jgi:ubiquinone/menaquinone biosynthesis C-methylase UbiE
MNNAIKETSAHRIEGALRYDQVIEQPVYNYYVHKKLRFIKKWLSVKHTLLDVGCGTGVYTNAVASQCKMIVGVDVSPEMVKRGISKAKHLCLDNSSFVVGDIAHLPFRDGVFELVFSINLFHHVADEKNIISGLLEKVRCCRGYGHILISELNANSLGWSKDPIPKTLRNFVFLLLYPFHQNVIDHIEEGTSIVNIAELLGRITEIKVVLREIGGFIPPYCPKFLLKSFVLLERIMEATPFLRRYGAHILVVGKVYR